jgi:DNA-binding beta-propeller fold protein YncE
MSTFGQQKMYWANKNPAQINVSNIDGSDTKTIITQNLPQYHFLDNENGKIYWTDKAKSAVIQCNLDGSNQIEFIKNLVNPKGIFIDSISQFYLVVDNKIQIFSKSGIFLKTFISDLKQPSDLIIYKGIAYWGNQEEHSIEYMALNNGSKKVLITGAIQVSDLDINTKTNEIFYNSFDPNLKGIYKAGLDGKNIKRLTKDKTDGFALDAEKEILYWGFGILKCIYKSNLNNLNNPITFVTDRENPFRIIINKKDDKLYFLDHNYGNFLFTSSLSNGGSSSKVLASSVIYLPTRFEIDSLNRKIYWINSHTSFPNSRSQAIMKSNLDGTEVKQLINYPKVKYPFGIALDINVNKIYWTDSETKSIGVMDLDGSNDKVFINDKIDPRELKIDLLSKKLYWTDFESKKLLKANLDGSNIEEVINLNNTFSFGFDISHKNNKMFWTNQNDNSIYSAELNGSNITKVLQTSSTFNGLSAICFDEIDSKLYFTDNNNIYKSDIDGSNFKTLLANLSPTDIYILNDKSSGSRDFDSNIKLEVFPNPLINTINLRSSSIINSVEIFEVSSGKSIIKELNINKLEHSINTESYNLISGLYIMKIHTKNSYAIRKIFKL